MTVRYKDSRQKGGLLEELETLISRLIEENQRLKAPIQYERNTSPAARKAEKNVRVSTSFLADRNKIDTSQTKALDKQYGDNLAKLVEKNRDLTTELLGVKTDNDIIRSQLSDSNITIETLMSQNKELNQLLENYKQTNIENLTQELAKCNTTQAQTQLALNGSQAILGGLMEGIKSGEILIPNLTPEENLDIV